jgi:hypothetical protein
MKNSNNISRSRKNIPKYLKIDLALGKLENYPKI